MTEDTYTWKGLTGLSDYVDSLYSDADPIEAEGLDQIATAIDNMQARADRYFDRFGRYAEYAKPAISKLGYALTVLFACWGALGGLIIVSICILDKGKCKLFWICNHISWIAMIVMSILAFVFCLLLSLLICATATGCDVISDYYPSNLESFPEPYGAILDRLLTNCVDGDGTKLSSRLPDMSSHPDQVMVTELVDGLNCNFLANTAERTINSVCGHANHALAGLASVMWGMGLLGSGGLVAIIYLNLYIHNRKDGKSTQQ